jgi:drug/metabolite transporter (DMT)-like permease
MPIPLNILLALAAAVFWGAGDFSGGMAVQAAPSKKSPTANALRAVLFSHLTSYAVLLVLALRNSTPPTASILWGLLAGLTAGISLTSFYLALSRGTMGASAAISGLLAAAIPAGFTLFTLGSPGPTRLAGFSVAAIAIWLIAAGPAHKESRQTILLATFSGIGFGLYFTLLHIASAHATPFWTMLLSRTASILTCGALLLLTRQRKLVILSAAKDLCISATTAPSPSRILSPRMAIWVLSTAIFDTSGNLAFVTASRAGRLDIAAVVASLYPAGTILLAAVILRERPTPRQLTGMALAAAAVLLITL